MDSQLKQSVQDIHPKRYLSQLNAVKPKVGWAHEYQREQSSFKANQVTIEEEWENGDKIIDESQNNSVIQNNHLSVQNQKQIAKKKYSSNRVIPSPYASALNSAMSTQRGPRDDFFRGISMKSSMKQSEQTKVMGQLSIRTMLDRQDTDEDFRMGVQMWKHDQQFDPIRKAVAKAFENQMLNVSEYVVKFHFGYQIKFFIYHVLFYVMGTLVVIPISIIDSPTLANNMYLWVRAANKMPLGVQTFQWLIITFVNLMFLFKKYEIWPEHFELRNIYYEQLVFINAQTVIRAFIVSIRYAYTSSTRMHQLKTQLQPAEFVSRDLMLNSWIILYPSKIKFEIDAVLWRNKVEESFFWVKIYGKLDPMVQERLTNADFYTDGFSIVKYRKEIKARVKYLKDHWYNYFNGRDKNAEKQNTSGKVIPSPKESFEQVDRIDCKLLLREIVLMSCAQQWNIIGVCIVIAFGQMSIPYVLRYYKNGTPFDFDASAVIFCVVEFIVNWILLYFNIFFVMTGPFDFQRRMFTIQACGNLIKPDRMYQNPAFQILPIIDFSCPNSLHAWYKLRQCSLDFGRKYLRRVHLYASVFLLFSIAYLAFYFMNLFFFGGTADETYETCKDYLGLHGFDTQFMTNITAEERKKGYFNFVLNTYCFYDFGVVFLGIMVMFYYGAVINKQYEIDKAQLIKIRSATEFFKLNSFELVRKRDSILDQTLKMIVNVLVPVEVQQELLKLDKEQQELYIKGLKKKAKRICEECEAVIRKLEVEENMKAFKIAGLKATYSLIETMLTTLVTVVVASIEKILH